MRIAILLLLCGVYCTKAAPNDCQEETKTLDELYQDALAEGGRLIIYAGGDTANQQDGNKQAFLDKFPEINITIIVDYSKYHDARIDFQLQTNTLVPDIAQLQTLQDFPRWKKQGVLLNYKPAGYCKLHESIQEADGAWNGIFVDAFSIIYNNDEAGDSAPKTLNDLLTSNWKGQIVSTYPNDDDAVLFLYKTIVDKYGWDWLDKFVAQEIKWVRGTQEPCDEVEAGTTPVALGTDGMLVPAEGVKTRFVVPDTDPFMAWAQRAAIFKDAKNIATAKLYLNWWLSPETQANFYMWPVRTDITPPGNYTPAWDIANSNMQGFVDFMSDREGAERFRTELALHVGEVKGDPSPGWLGLYPGRD